MGTTRCGCKTFHTAIFLSRNVQARVIIVSNLRRSLRLAVLLLWAPLTAACQNNYGNGFKRLGGDNVTLGRTTEQDILRLEGRPWQWNVSDTKPDPAAHPSPFTHALVRGVWSMMHYQFLNNHLVGADAVEAENFWFFDHRLTGWRYLSDASMTATTFDMARAQSVHAGMTQDQVHTLLGASDGQCVYPLIADPRGTVWTWNSRHVKGGRVESRALKVAFGPDQRVIESEVETAEQP